MRNKLNMTQMLAKEVWKQSAQRIEVIFLHNNSDLRQSLYRFDEISLNFEGE